MRILVLSQYYNPEPVPKPAELAAGMRERGHQVQVITGIPNYPSGKVYPGFRLRCISRDEVDGIPVLRAFEYPYHGRSVAGRLFNYGSFVVSAPLAALRVSRADVMYVWHPPLTIGLAAWLISRLRGIPFVYDVQDIWPEAAVLSGMLRDGVAVRLLSRLERFVYRRAAHILVSTAGARENLLAKGVPPEIVTVAPHWIGDEQFAEVTAADREAVRTEHGWDGRFVVMFAGNLGAVQGLETVIRSATALETESKALFVFVGDGSDRARLESLVRSAAASDRVQFAKARPASEMPRFFAAADTLLVHLRRSRLSELVIPTKTLSYLASGKPLIMAMEGEAARLVSAAGAGVLAEPENESSLANAVRTLETAGETDRAAMGSRGREFVRREYGRKKTLDQIEALLAEAAAR